MGLFGRRTVVEPTPELEASPFQELLCFVDEHLVDPLYMALTLVVILSPVLPFLQELSAHGKTRRSSSSVSTLCDWFLNGRIWLVPKRWFAHFYLTGLAAVYAMHRWSGTAWQVSSIVLATHLMRRLHECLVVHQWRASSRMHVGGYLLGLLHYLVLPLVFVTLPCQGHDTETLVTPKWSTTVLVLLAWWAQYQQYRHHCILASLRQPRSDHSDGPRDEYTLPRGGWFDRISCPHYLAEILLYGALVGLLQLEHFEGRRPWLLWMWVTANLTVSARASHQWYERHFPYSIKDGRKAIIPYLY